jgi:energy-coupling factor transporter ATP-binding protein EcfA2
MISITLKNYRCFTDTKPATIDFEPGLTAFVGPNNSGKSAFLKFFCEFQNLWNHLLDARYLAQLNANPNDWHGTGGGLRSVVDTQEILCDFTSRPLVIEFQLRSRPENRPYLDSILLRSQLANPAAWQGTFRCMPNGFTIHKHSNENILSQTGETIWYEPFRDLFQALCNCLYAPAFRNAINQGSGSYYDFAVGTSLVSLWNTWKTGDSRTTKKAIQTVTDDIRRIFNFGSLEINMPAGGTNFEVVADGRPYRLNDLGAGLSQFIILFANLAVRKPPLLLLDEPELNLHPSLQIDFLTSLASYTTTGSVIFATHSLGLARAIADRIFTFSPTPEGTIVTPFDRTPNYAEFAGELSFSSFRELGFATILMVEGPSEVKAVQQLLRLLDRDHQVVVLHLGGSSMIAPRREEELAELKRITDSVAVLIDSERNTPEAELSPDRAQFMRDCEALGFKVHATKLRAFENYLPDHAVKTIKGDQYRALTPYERLDDLPIAWGKSENWRIARLMNREELMSTDLGEFLASLDI